MTPPSAAGGRGLTRLFSDRKIATKIAIGFACVLTITAAISAMAFMSFVKVGNDFEGFERRVGMVDLARDVDREFLAFRRYVREYAVTGEAADLAAAEKGRSAVLPLIERATKEINDREQAAKIKHLAEQFAVYSKDFDKLVGFRGEQIKLTKDVLDPFGARLRAEIEQLQNWAAKAGNPTAMSAAGEALKHLLLARLNVTRLLVRHEPAVAADAEKAFSDAKAALTALAPLAAGGDVRKQFDTIVAGLDRYHEAAKKAAHDAHEIERLLNGEMRRMAQAIAADAAAVKQAGIAEEKIIEKEITSLIASTEVFILVLALAGMFLGIVLAWLIGRGISLPIRKIGDVLVELANGNKTVDVPYADRGDEVGDNARAAKTFKENLLRIEKMEAEQRETERRTAEQRKADMFKLADNFEAAVGGIIGTVSSASTELEAAATTLTQTAETTQRLSTTVASASEEASSNVQSVASATEELTSSVHEIARQVQESSKIAGEAVRQAERTDARINELSQAASRIGDVVKLITAIAEQTNLLALNATIEAARAGEAGRGFAVVAQEVKALASQTAKATDEISTQIAGMQTATQDSVGAIKEIGATIGRISEIASTIAAAVEEQGAATQEIARNVQEAAKGASDVASNIVEVNHGASETGSASTQVLSSAQSLAGESSRLKVEVEKFLHTVRAA